MIGLRTLSYSVVPFGVLLTGCNSGSQHVQARSPRVVALNRTVQIPTVNLGSLADPAKLTVTTGGPDELPQGPNGFDVASDGRLLIADPLRQRIAVFNPTGGYISEWRLGFGPDSITILADGTALVRESNSGESRAFNLDGKPKPGATAAPPALNARLTGPNSATVNRRSGSGQTSTVLNVKFEVAGLKLLSIQGIDSDPQGNTYVAVESTSGGDSVEVKKTVRKYSRESQLVAETSDLLLDYYIRPVDELRVRKGVVYQLMPTSSAIHINVWDTN